MSTETLLRRLRHRPLSDDQSLILHLLITDELIAKKCGERVTMLAKSPRRTMRASTSSVASLRRRGLVSIEKASQTHVGWWSVELTELGLKAIQLIPLNSEMQAHLNVLIRHSRTAP